MPAHHSSFSPTTLAFASDRVPFGQRLASVDRTGEHLQRQEAEAQNWVRLSPDGRRLARQRIADGLENPDIWVDDRGSARGGSHCGATARYARPMRSVADQLRRQTAARVLDLPILARIELSLQLGDDDVTLCAAHAQLGRDEARRRLRAQRAHGRRLSRAARLDADDAPQPSR